MKAVVTVVGKDRVGIIATVCTQLASFNINVLDISQTVMQGYFTMMMVVDVSESNIPVAELARQLEERGKEIKENIFDHYYLTYSVRVRTNKVDVVAKNILKIHELAMRKLDVSITAPQYFISNPEQYKLELVNAASASAAERARTAARQSGSDLGPLMTARQGVIQITRSASNDTSDYGMYDTTSIQKVIRLVMTMEFALK